MPKNLDILQEKLPVRLDRRIAAELISLHFFPISPRTLERWPIGWRRINGKALAETADILAEAKRQVDAAAAVRGGR